MRSLRIALLTLLIWNTSVTGQTNRLAFDWTNGPVVLEGSDTVLFAFSGGADLPQFSTVDLDLDGDEDLAIFDRQGNRWNTFLNENGTWVSAPNFAEKFPKISYWGLFRDFNCDGKKDLFAYVLGGIGVWENTSSIDSLSFAWALPGSFLQTMSGSTPTNLYSFNSDIPAIYDLDGDGDLDILTFGQRSTVEWHENTSNCGLTFHLNTTCWGRFEENLSTNDLTLNGCAGVQKMEFSQKTTGAMHAGSSLLALNLNGDTLTDLLIGDVSFTNLVAAYNGGNIDSAFMISKDTLYPSPYAVNIEYFPAAFYEDVTFDGVPDLLVAPNLNGSINTGNSWLYTNSGTANQPTWNALDTSFLVDEMLDFGSSAKPALVDLDFDGDYDLVVGSMGPYIAPSTYKSALRLYKNIGTNTAPKFQFADGDLANAGYNNLGEELSPTFGDLDGDLDPDMIVGAKNGQLYYYENTGTFLSHAFTYRGSLQGIDVGNYATPFLGDVDGDGDFDLLIGNETGTIAYYKHTGSYPTFFSLEANPWAGIDMSSNTAPSGFSAPALIYGSDTTLFIGSEDLGVVQKDSLRMIMSGASSTDVILGGGTTSSTTREETPFGGSKRNGRTQLIISKDELLSNGAQFGQFESIGFELGSNTSLYLTQGFTISMKHISDTSLTSFQNQGFTQVFSGIRVLLTGWNDIPLDVPFTWNGADHVLIEICFSKHAQTGDIPVILQATPYHAMLYGDVSSWNGIMNDGCLMPYGGRSKMRPNLRFNLVPTLRDSDAHFTAAGQRLHPAVADLNADGYPDVILGNHSGGLHYFQGKAFNDISVQELNLSEEPCLIYPNPARNWIQFECTQASIVSVHIYSSTGEHVAQLAPNKRTSLELAPGLYVAVFQNKDGGLHRQKLIIL